MANLNDDWVDQFSNDPVSQQAQAATSPVSAPGVSTALQNIWGGGSSGSSSASASPTPAPAPPITASLGVSPQLATWDQPAAAPAPPDYTAHVQAAASGDPVAADTLARRVAQDLQFAGHDISWNGSQLIVDGRPYNVAGSTPTATAPTAGGTDIHANPNAAGYNPDPNFQARQGIMLTYQSYLGRQPNEQEIAQWIGNPDYFNQIKNSPEAQMYAKTGVPNAQPLNNPVGGGAGTVGDQGIASKTFAAFLNAHPELSGDAATQAFAQAFPQYASDKGLWYGDRQTFAFPDVLLYKDPVTGLWGPGSGTQYGVPRHDGGSAGGNAGMPSQIPSVSGLSASDLLSLWNSINPATNAGPTLTKQSNPQLDQLWSELSANPTGANASVDKLVQSIVDHPDAISPHDVQMMEAASDEEQQQAALSGDQAAKRFGYQAGIADSPWLASERAASARSADQGILSSRRTIELTADQANAEARRAAAQIGLNQEQMAQQLTIAVYNAGLGKENLDQQLEIQAANLGVSKQQLAQALYLQLVQLEQQNEQFGANLGLGYAQLNNDALNQYWNGVTA